jgi:hypothetical protein
MLGMGLFHVSAAAAVNGTLGNVAAVLGLNLHAYGRKSH